MAASNGIYGAQSVDVDSHLDREGCSILAIDTPFNS